MHNPQSLFSASSKKQFDKLTVTETHTHTHTDKLDSNFDHLHDEITSQGVHRYQKAKNLPAQKPRQKTLSKVRSMPHTEFSQIIDEEIKEPIVVDTPINLRKFPNDIKQTFSGQDGATVTSHPNFFLCPVSSRVLTFPVPKKSNIKDRF